MVGGEFVRNILHANGGGVTGIYGRQFSEIVFLGVGFGVDTYIRLENRLQPEQTQTGLSLFLGIDCILGPWYANVPVSLGIRYGF